MRYVFLLVFLFAAGDVFAADGGVPNVRYPCTAGDNLAGQSFKLPEDFEGQYTIAIHAFEREHQELVNTWFPFLDEIEDAREDVKYFEIPTMDKFNPIKRWFVNNGMKTGIPEDEQRARTINLYLDNKEQFVDSLGMDDLDDIYVVLLNKKGHVIHKEKGSATLEKVERLKKRIGG